MSAEKGIRYELLSRLCPNSTGAEIHSVCTEAGMYAIRARRKMATEKDFLDAVNKVIKAYAKNSIDLELQKELESWRKAEYAALGFTGTLVGPQMLMSDEILDRLVDLAHVGALRAPEQLAHEIDWVFSGKYATTLVELIHRLAPPPPIAPKHRAAANSRSDEAQTNVTPQSNAENDGLRQPKKRVCRQCHQPGHNVRTCQQNKENNVIAPPS